MPKLPTYDSQNTLTTQQPEVTRTGASATAEAVGRLAGVAEDLSIKWHTAVKSMETTKIKSQHAVLSAKIEAEAIVFDLESPFMIAV